MYRCFNQDTSVLDLEVVVEGLAAPGNAESISASVSPLSQSESSPVNLAEVSTFFLCRQHRQLFSTAPSDATSHAPQVVPLPQDSPQYAHAGSRRGSSSRQEI